MWLGSTVSSIGTQFTRVSVPYLVYQQTGSVLALGTISAITLLPMLTCAIVGGAIADVFDRRQVARLTAVVGASVSALHVLNVSIGHPRLWAIYALHAVGMSLM